MRCGVLVAVVAAMLASGCGETGAASPTQPGANVAPAPAAPPTPAPAPPAPVEPPALASLTLTPVTIESQGSTEGRVTLTREAPDGGIVVTLSSSNVDVARPPSSVTVPAGAASATFQITAPTIGRTATATISASYANVTHTASLTVTPPSLAPAIRVFYSGLAGSGEDLCFIVSPAGDLSCELQGGGSRGFPTRYLWTISVGSNRIELSSTNPSVRPVTTCAFFSGAVLDPWIEMEVTLQVERDGVLSSTASRTVRVGSELHIGLGNNKEVGYCNIPVPR